MNPTDEDDLDPADLPDPGDPDPKRDRKLRAEAKLALRSPEQSRAALRRKVRMFYDLQRLRIQTAGRGLKKGTKPESEERVEVHLHELDVEILNQRSKDLLRAEKAALSDIKAHLETLPVYVKILSDKSRFKGIGPTLAAVILSEVDIERARTVSALWRYAGLAPVAGLRCSVCHDTVVEKGGELKHEFDRKTDRCRLAGEVLQENATYASHKTERGQKGEKSHYNRFLKTKMVGVMSSCLLKAGSPYRKFYDDYKHRLEHLGRGRTDGHRHQMALRYMVKMVLLDIYNDWRTLEGLPIRAPYAEEYLGRVHGAG